jgi:hypothetical protein
MISTMGYRIVPCIDGQFSPFSPFAYIRVNYIGTENGTKEKINFCLFAENGK